MLIQQAIDFSKIIKINPNSIQIPRVQAGYSAFSYQDICRYKKELNRWHQKNLGLIRAKDCVDELANYFQRNSSNLMLMKQEDTTHIRQMIATYADHMSNIDQLNIFLDSLKKYSQHAISMTFMDSIDSKFWLSIYEYVEKLHDNLSNKLTAINNAQGFGSVVYKWLVINSSHEDNDGIERS